VKARIVLAVLLVAATARGGDGACPDRDLLRRPYFGDTHVHTRFSLDAGLQGTRMTPAQAYEFARGADMPIQPFDATGKPLRHLRLARPLDFLAVSDHAEFFGEMAICENPADPGYSSPECLAYRLRPNEAFLLFNTLLSTGPTNLPTEPKRVRRIPYCGLDGAQCFAASKAFWDEEQRAAKDAYTPCEFTSFVGYEWSGSPDVRNLHRNVIFRTASVPERPMSYFDAPTPELLWKSLAETCTPPACEALTIPHNSNLSSGKMFRTKDSKGDPFTLEYALTRQAYEPLFEIFQHKGDSECFRLRGPGKNDELCGFEKFPYDNLIADRFDGLLTAPPKESDFVRDALKVGLAEERRLGVNPFKYGIIASTDTHQGTPGAAVEDAKFPGHGGAGHASQGQIAPGLQESIAFNPGGLAVVWAEENTRDAIFSAMKRRETYGTSGPRMLVRFFGGWVYPADLCQSNAFAYHGYGGGVPMGGDLPARPGNASAPRFAVAAMRDPGASGVAPDPGIPGDLGGFAEPSIPLERVQIIKGWVDPQGERRERVYEVAGDARGGAAVDLATCEPRGVGFDSLCTVWQDPEFDPATPAFYYVRVVQNPTCRWSTLQCNAAGIDCSKPDQVADEWKGCCDTGFPKTIQERAWTSPIWYKPVAR
jgi:hypothetical protein